MNTNTNTNEENVIFETGMHKIGLYQVIGGFVGFYILVGFWLPGPLQLFNVLIVIMAMIGTAVTYLKIRFSKLIVTDRNIKAEIGFFTKQVMNIPIEKVESVRLSRGPLGQMLNYGDIIIVGTGGSEEKIRQIENAEEVEAAVRKAIRK
jgi:membrane protein YdbS with pleckstrin-like domain